METPTPKAPSFFKRILPWVLLIAIFIFLGRIVWENWNQVRGASFSFRAGPLLLATLVFVLSYFVQIWAWYLITLRLRIAIPLRETLGSWLYSQLGKYLPGKVWLLLSRYYFYESKGKSKKAITVALYLETATLVMAAGLVYLMSLLFMEEVRLLTFGIPWIGLIFLFLLSLFLLHPKVLQILFNFILKRLRKEPLFLSLSYPDVLQILTICVLSWIVGGMGFYLFVDSVFSVSSKYFLFLTGALAISSTLGLAALFAPSGLGVREGVLVYLLSFVMPGPVAVIFSVLTRLWMTFIEIGMIGVVYLLNKLRRKEIEKR